MTEAETLAREMPGRYAAAIQHEHTSAPVDFGAMKAITTR